MNVYLEPVGLLSGAAAAVACDAGDAVSLAGGPLAFSALHLIERAAGTPARFERLSLAAWRARADDNPVLAERFARLTKPRSEFAGFTMRGDVQVRIMGIVNVTPDSFSDGGAHADPTSAIAHAHALTAAGADILDIGGESTRPGAEPVEPLAELARVLPVVEALATGPTPVSIDTRRASVMKAALGAGAVLVNDVTALTGDPESLGVVSASTAPVVLMHMAGEPRTMQRAPSYKDVTLDVFDALAARIAACEAAGIARDRICVDPGIGFGKTAAHNLALLNRLALFHGLGCPILIGASRKSFVARTAGNAPADQRLGGSLAAALAAVSRGCQLLRVHDVAETRQAIALSTAIDRQKPEINSVSG